SAHSTAPNSRVAPTATEKANKGEETPKGSGCRGPIERLRSPGRRAPWFRGVQSVSRGCGGAGRWAGRAGAGPARRGGLPGWDGARRAGGGANGPACLLGEGGQRRGARDPADASGPGSPRPERGREGGGRGESAEGARAHWRGEEQGSWQRARRLRASREPSGRRARAPWGRNPGPDGVVLVDPDYLKDRKVFVTLTCAFRYGREDLDVLGLSFRKDLFIATYQAFPPVPNPPRPPTRLQDRLLRKLGQHAHPFFFTIPQNLPCSVTLQPGPEDTGKACGVDFEIRAFCAKSLEEKSHKRNSVRLVIRKVQFAPEKPGPQPSAETTRHFLMSDRSLHLEASLDKELYYHGEPLNVNVHVTNNSTKTVKKIKVSVRQYADICLFSTAQYKCPVAQLEQDDQVSPSSTFCKVYTITPLLSDNREKRGLALDGKLKHEDTNLASSTIVKEGANKEVLGILVSYRVKVKLVVSRGGDVSVELPFVLMHPKPHDHTPLPRPQSAARETDVPVDTNLIEFDTNYATDDDIVFEDFARLRLKGMKDDDYDDQLC
uniref:Beta-arrestin-2 n=1 Tax=Piliocolobus tephrosceles TaxID=591936 RepID=A0A8C9J1N1_9PRIM